MDVVDLDNDNIAEILIEGVLYQLDSSGTYSAIKSFNKPYAFNLSQTVVDIDGDNLKDIIIDDKIYLARDFMFQTGLNYDPSHSGHGFSLENVGDDLFFTLFYSYDGDNYPTWYSDLGLFEKTQEDYWNISEEQLRIVKYNYDYDTNTIVPQTEASDVGYMAHNKCSERYGDVNLSYGFGDRTGAGGPTGLPMETGNWCSQPLVDYYKQAENNMSGLWWAGDNDSGWGWSIELIDNDMGTTDIVLLLYYYDAQGNPRWLIGNQSGFEAGQSISISMDMVKGYQRSETTTDVELLEAGTIEITLNQASNNLLNAGTMSIDVTYPGAEGGNWVRNNIPIALFSTPRNH
jgi:hypothetical protein